MAEFVTIARPYAEAIFKLAKGAGTLDVWSEQLQLAAMVAADPDMCRIVTDPRVDAKDVERIFLSVCGKKLDAEGVNLIRLLIENHRTLALPEISAQFERRRAEEGGALEAAVTSAFPLAGEALLALISGLERRFKRKISATVRVDPDLIGGVIIVAGDEVYDASVRGKLQSMAYALKS